MTDVLPSAKGKRPPAAPPAKKKAPGEALPAKTARKDLSAELDGDLIYSSTFERGGYEVKDKKKPIPNIAKNREGKLKFYNLHGEVDASRHAMRRRSSSWYRAKLRAARAFANARGNLEVDFPNDVKLQHIVDLIKNPGKLDQKALDGLVGKQTEKGRIALEDIYGPSGVLNLLLAFQRGVAPLLKKGIKYEDLEKHFGDQYDLFKKGAHVERLFLRLKKARTVRITRAPKPKES